MDEKKKQTSTKDASVRNTVSDLFAFVFSGVNALADLYRGLGKEISAEEIEYLNLTDFLQRAGRYNDTAFITKDNRLIVFVEHQSTKNPNMPFRFLEYAVLVLKVLETLVAQNRFGEKLMDFPRIEFYVAYNGKTTLEEAEKNLSLDLGFIKVEAQVVDICFDCLPQEDAQDTQNALAGYAYFTKIFGEAKAQGKKPYDAYRFAVDKSIEKGYLPEIWNRKECIDMFAETYCYDDQLREEGMEISAAIFNALKENLPIPAIAEKYGVSIQQVTKVKELFAV
ncbi:MAG: hypothetical protein FWC08_13915 [Defluviitaleaceae bacterium]|nr:hypothetical protein [Defluviitaleaceae bacterium]